MAASEQTKRLSKSACTTDAHNNRLANRQMYLEHQAVGLEPGGQLGLWVDLDRVEVRRRRLRQAGACRCVCRSKG
jgi:hypothetical protein